MKPGDRISLQWIDSQTTYGWQRLDEDDTPAIIESCGLLVRETPEDVTISTSRGPTGRFLDALTIPRCAIRQMRRLCR